jgi:hypothetical protein
VSTRQTLRRRAFNVYATYDQGARRMVTRCPWCREPIEDGFDLHEYLVKRSAVPKDKQDLVMVPQNVVPVHHHCHMEAGQGKEMTRRCLYAAAMALGANDVGHWYVQLWEEHGLSVRKGFLVPPKSVALSTAIRYFKAGCALQGIQLEQQPENDKVIGMAIQRWRGHLVANPKRYQDVPFAALVRAVDDGYWFSYLKGVAGLS